MGRIGCLLAMPLTTTALYPTRVCRRHPMESLSLPWRPPQIAVRCIPAFRSCAVSKLAKPNGYAPAWWPERLSSATAANGFAALPSSRASSMNDMSPAPIAEPHATPPSAGQTLCSPISRTACSPPTEWSPPNICRATSAPSPGVSTDALSSKQSTSASPSRQRQLRQCPTASSNWLRLDGKQDPYYRGLGGADFSKQRRPGGAVGTIGGFSPIALPIALEINDPRYDVMLAPAHRRKWASWRSAEIRTASMKPQLKLGLSSPHPDLSRCSKTAGSSKRPPARATASRPSAIAQKSSAACRIPVRA